VSAAPWPHGDPNAVVRAVLAQPAYRDAQEAAPPPSPFMHLLDRALDAIRDTWQKLFPHGIDPHTAGVVGWAAVLAAYAALLALLILVALRIARALGPPRAGTRAALPAPVVARRHTLLADAAAAAAAGAYARAIALLFRAALFDLDGAALVPYDPARTPGEYRRRVRGALAAAAVPFDELTARFIRAAFGKQVPQAGDYDAARRAYAAFSAAAGTA
jgi:hypothetical protein